MKVLELTGFLSVCFVSCLHFATCAQDYYGAALDVVTRLVNPAVYDKTVPPKQNNSRLVNIHTRVLAEMTTHVGLADESLETTIAVCGSWKDERLSWMTWNVSQVVGWYTAVSLGDIWWPRLGLINTYSEDIRMDRNDATIVDVDGKVLWCTIITAEVPCTMDMSSFPYDAHECTLKFASLSYTDEDLSYTTELVTKAAGTVSSGWTIQSMSFEKGNVLNHTSLDLSLRLQRKGDNFVYMVKLPSIAVTLVTLLVFLMPPSSDRRVTLGCLNLLFAMFMLLWLDWWLGPSTAVPWIIPFLGGVMLAQAVAIAFSVLVINMTSTQMPFDPPGSLVHFLRGPVATILCLSTTPATSDDILLQDEEQDRQETSSKEDLLKQQDWYLVAQGLDRLVFVLFGIVLIALQV